MSCINCNEYALYKVLCFCSGNNRYEYYCGECFMTIFSLNCRHCNNQMCNSIVLKEFTWENAFEHARILRNVFPKRIEIENEEIVSCDNSSDITQSENESISECDNQSKVERMLEVYLYILIKGSKYFLSEDSGEWSLAKDRKQIFQFIMLYDEKANKVINDEIAIKKNTKYMRKDNDCVTFSKKYEKRKDFFFKFYGFTDGKHKDLKYGKYFLIYQKGNVIFSENCNNNIMWIAI